MTAKTRLGSRVRKWLALVAACALPLEAFIWNKEEVLRQQFAVLLGVAIWIAVMAGLDAWLLSRGRTRASRALGFGALAFAVIQGILALVSISGFIYIYWLVFVMLRAAPVFFPTQSRFGMTLVLTIVCGMSALIWVLLFVAICLLFDRRPAVDEA
jgi:hypothetical protein